MRTFVSRFSRQDAGATAIEYALVAALIAVVITTAVGGVATKLVALFGLVDSSFP